MSDTSEDQFPQVFDKVLKFLTFRPRSELEIKTYLQKKEIKEELKEKIWAKLMDLNLINDKDFTAWWIEQRSGRRPKGRNILVMELKQKGVAEEIVEELLKESRKPDNEVQLAEKIVLKLLPKLKDLPFWEAKRKLYEALARRGFSYSIVEDVIAKTLKRE